MKRKLIPFDQIMNMRQVKSQPKKLLIVELRGGLGNQLFQFANGVSLSIRSDCQIVFEMKDLKRKFALNNFGIHENTRYKIEIDDNRNLQFFTVGPHFPHLTVAVENILESQFTYKHVHKAKNLSRISGYFQSHKYFEEHLDEIKKYLSKFVFEAKNIKPATNCSVEAETTAHVRLGDYLNDRKTREYHGLLKESYFLEAIKEFANKKVILVTESKIELSETYPNLQEISCEVFSGNLLEDFTKLATAKHLVIANSSFSWWAALLSNAEIIAPKQWFSPDVLKLNPTNDLFPKGWKLI